MLHSAASSIDLQFYTDKVMFTVWFGSCYFLLCPEFFRVDNWAELSELMLECKDLRWGQSNYEISGIVWKHRGIWVWVNSEDFSEMDHGKLFL